MPLFFDALKACAQFDRCDEPDMSVVGPYTGERYRASEAYWIAEFAGDDVQSVKPGIQKTRIRLRPQGQQP